MGSVQEIDLTKDNFMDIMKSMHSSSGVFLNSECLFVEYHDIIKMPWYVLMTIVHQNEKLLPLINIKTISGLDDTGMLEWYCNRSNRNPLIDIASAPLDKVDYDMLLDVLMTASPILYEADTELNGVQVIKTAIKQGLAKNVIFYSEKNEPSIDEDIERIFGKSSKIEVCHGSFRKLLETKIPDDTTYMLSDFNRVITLADTGKLNYASLVLPYDYAYNFIIHDDGTKEPIVDLEYLGKENVFKVAYFNACYI